MTSKYDQKCALCDCVVENKKGVVKDYVVKNLGDDKKPNYKKICKGCDSKYSGAQK
jgi:hypothetical protein